MASTFLDAGFFEDGLAVFGAALALAAGFAFAAAVFALGLSVAALMI